MLILYEFALSPYAQKVKIALREKGLEFEQRVALVPETAEGFTDGNPRREVPMLVDGDTRIWDSTVILDYLDEQWPQTPLLPKDPALRARTRLIEELADSRLEALNYCIGEVMTFPSGEMEAAEAVVVASRREISRLHRELETYLGNADYFGGSAPNRADISLIPMLNASRVMKNGPNEGPLAEWVTRMNERTSVGETIAEIRPAIALYKELMGRIHRGEEARLMRDHRLDWLMQAGGAPIVAKRLEEGSIRFSGG